jgi:dimethylargininase
MSVPPVFTHALVRPPTRSLAECQLLHLPRQSLDLDQAVRQHAGYVSTLVSEGVTVTRLPAVPDLPDAVFVEDTVVILDEVAIICRPGAVSRLKETSHIAAEVAQLRRIAEIDASGTLEGGDVLRVGRTIFVGRSTRTNAEGIRQLKAIVSPYGYQVKEVAVTGCLHLKTAITSPGKHLMIANPNWIDLSAFHAFEIIPTPTTEPWGANTVPLNGKVLVAATAPKTSELLASRGLEVRRVDVSELQKAEAGLTCLSVLYERRQSAPPR